MSNPPKLPDGPYYCMKCKKRWVAIPVTLLNTPIWLSCDCGNLNKDSIYFIDTDKMEVKGVIDNLGDKGEK